MTAPLVDTNVLSELARPHPNPGVLRWASQNRGIALSVVTLEEILFGLAWRPNPRIAEWFESYLEEHCELLPVTPRIAARSGELRGRLRSQGRTRHQADMLIAATADIEARTLVTRNSRDFEGCGVTVLDPFDQLP